MAETRLRLVATELEEEKSNLIQLILLAGAALLLTAFGLMSLMILVMWAVDPVYRLTAVIIMTSVLLGGALIFALWAVRKARRSSLLGATREQLAIDRQLLERKSRSRIMNKHLRAERARKKQALIDTIAAQRSDLSQATDQWLKKPNHLTAPGKHCHNCVRWLSPVSACFPSLLSAIRKNLSAGDNAPWDCGVFSAHFRAVSPVTGRTDVSRPYGFKIFDVVY